LIIAFRGQDLDKLLNDVKKANYVWVVASVISCFTAHIVRALRWNMLIEPLGYGKPKITSVFYAVMIGYLANLALPRMGEISRCGVLNKTDKIPVNHLIGTVIVERIIDLFMLILIILVTVLFQFKFISHFLYTHVLLRISGIINAGNLLFFTLIFLAVAFSIYYLVIKKDILGISERIKVIWTGFKSGLNSIKFIQHKKVFILYSILLWLLYYFSTYLCFFAVETTSKLGLTAALTVLVFGSLGMIVPVQGGIGAYHWMVTEGLTLYGIERTNSLAYATIIHSSQTLLILFVGAISLLLTMISISKQNKNETTGIAGT
jgi:glycosyltransferase 2 family protein